MLENCWPRETFTKIFHRMLSLEILNRSPEAKNQRQHKAGRFWLLDKFRNAFSNSPIQKFSVYNWTLKVHLNFVQLSLFPKFIWSLKSVFYGITVGNIVPLPIVNVIILNHFQYDRLKSGMLLFIGF